ncbi:MAG: IS66 family transposase [Gammaproteobacteria bacterium]|nr:MAG: IS66 family transposase [Gammaproteobacteria bacterium]
MRGMDLTAKNFNSMAAQITQLKAENRFLKLKLQAVLGKLFGKSSEKISPDQLMLAFGVDSVDPETPAAEAEVEEVASSRKKRKHKPLSERIPADLPVEEVVIEPEEVLADPEAFKRIGEEVTEELDVVPTKFFKRRIVRPKYVRKADRSLPPVVAPAPKRIIENSYASAGLLANIVLGKYVDHLPLYRQAQINKTRFGVEISRQTMADWMYRLSQMLAMIYEAMREEIRSSTYLQIDETPVRYQNPGSGKCGQGYLWPYHAPGKTVFFEWHTGRASECLDKTLNGFKGIVQSDGYSAYGAYKKRHPQAQIEYAACWAHARRKFHEARNESPFAAQMLLEIQGLYKIEADLRDNPKLDRRVVRQEKSVPILQRIGLQLRAEQAVHRPKSQTGKAIGYTLNLWDKLLLYTEHAQMEIDNNLVENAIRPTAIGKKNWLFFGSADAGHSSAIHYTLLETCRKLGINPNEYLRDILPRLPHMTNRTAKDYTPATWKASRENQ